MKSIIQYLLIITSLFFFIFSFASVDSIKKVADRLSFYRSYYSQEKIYVHTDKPLYAAGEDIWFKVYLLNATFHTPDTSDKVIYVELLNANKTLVKRLVLPANKGWAAGDFHLGDSIPQNKYVIRAYTNYMKNFPEDFWYIKEIQVLNPDFQSNKTTSAQQKTDLQFFPEGGNMLHGVANRLAFKAIDQFGKGVDVIGTILDEKDSTIISFNSVHDGMGSVSFIPVKGKTYKAKLNNGSQTYPLPEVMSNGYLLRIDESGKNLRLIVYRNTEGESKDSTPVYIVAHTRGFVCYAAGGTLAKNFMIKIPQSRFPSGIAHFTVFDKNFVPQCERLFFINHQESLQFGFSANKTSYKHREMVNAGITVKDKYGNPIAGNYSISVYDAKVKDVEKFPETINSYLLLSSDLQGPVKDPGYYFKDTLPQTKQHLDMVMMTNGWRRFSWKNVLKDTAVPPAYFREKGITLSGKVRKSLVNKPAIGSQVKLFYNEGDIIIAKTDSLGRFYIDQLNYYDSTKVIIQTDNAKGKQSDLRLTLNPFNISPPLIYKPTPLVNIDAQAFLSQTDRRNQIQKMKLGKTIMLKEVEVKDKKSQQNTSNNTTGNGVFKLHQSADYSIKGSDIPAAYYDVLSVLQGRVPGLQVSGIGANTQIQIRGGGQPTFMLDGMYVPVEVIMSINPGMVESIDVLTSPSNTSVYGGMGGNGIIAIYTKRGSYNSDPAKGITSFSYPGYYRAREFYMPKYNAPGTDNNIPDIRTTLYWNPNIITDSTGKAEVSFFTSDISSDYKILIEGISNKGIPGTYYGNIEVR